MQIYLTIAFIQLLFFVCANCLHSTNTAYHDSFTQDQLNFLLNISNYDNKECSTEQIYVVIRHGTSYPSNRQVDLAIDLLQYLRGNSRKQSSIYDVNGTVFNDPNSQLSKIGSVEMRVIAARFRERYPNLFKNIVLSQSDFVSSSQYCVIDSATNFTSALLCTNLDANKKTECESELRNKIKTDDHMMKAFALCKRYIKMVKKDRDSYIEMDLFKQSKYVKGILQEFKDRFMVFDSFEIFLDDLQKISEMCDMETTLKMSKNWCGLMFDRVISAVDYYNDLYHYWIQSHGNELSSITISSLVNDFIEETKSYMKKDSKRQKVLIRFGHSENLFALIRSLQLFVDDSPLKWNTLEEQTNRLFKSSIISPFGGNIALLLLKCGSEYRVQVMVNELPVDVINAGKLFCAKDTNSNGNNPFAKSTCNYEEFVEGLKKIIDNHYDESCDYTRRRSEL